MGTVVVSWMLVVGCVAPHIVAPPGWMSHACRLLANAPCATPPCDSACTTDWLIPSHSACGLAASQVLHRDERTRVWISGHLGPSRSISRSLTQVLHRDDSMCGAALGTAPLPEALLGPFSEVSPAGGGRSLAVAQSRAISGRASGDLGYSFAGGAPRHGAGCRRRRSRAARSSPSRACGLRDWPRVAEVARDCARLTESLPRGHSLSRARLDRDLGPVSEPSLNLLGTFSEPSRNLLGTFSEPPRKLRPQVGRRRLHRRQRRHPLPAGEPHLVPRRRRLRRGGAALYGPSRSLPGAF